MPGLIVRAFLILIPDLVCELYNFNILSCKVYYQTITHLCLVYELKKQNKP